MTRSWLLLAALSLFASGCGWIQTLRHEVEDDDRKASSQFDYNAPENRYIPPPPATVGDGRAAPVAGTPVDLSGMRAKTGRVTKGDFIADAGRNENSLWNEDGQRNYLFAQNKLKTPGDLLTVVIEDELRKDMVGEVKKLLPPEFRDQEIRVPGLSKESTATEKAAGAAASAAAAGGGGLAAAQQGAVAGYSSTDILTAEILERYPNGNLRLRGIKRVPFKRQVRNIEVTAIVKGADIDESDTVKSSKFFEQRVELYR